MKEKARAIGKRKRANVDVSAEHLASPERFRAAESSHIKAGERLS